MHFIAAPVARQKNTPYDLIGSLRILTAKHSFGGARRLLHSSCQVSMVMMFIVSAEQALIHSVQQRLQSPPPSCLLQTPVASMLKVHPGVKSSPFAYSVLQRGEEYADTKQTAMPAGCWGVTNKVYHQSVQLPLIYDHCFYPCPIY